MISGTLPISKFSLLNEGKGATAEGVIPADAEFFQDHFPDFPILPGVLALEILRKMIACYYENRVSGAGNSLRLKQVRAVKFSNYLKPGDLWSGRVEQTAEDTEVCQWKGELRNVRGEMAAAAKMVFEKRFCSDLNLTATRGVLKHE